MRRPHRYHRGLLRACCAAPRLAHLLGDLPVEALGRLRSDRVMHRPVTRTTALPHGGRIAGRGPELSGQARDLG